MEMSLCQIFEHYFCCILTLHIVIITKQLCSLAYFGFWTHAVHLWYTVRCICYVCFSWFICKLKSWMSKIWKVHFSALEHAASRQTFQNFLDFSSTPVGEDRNVNPQPAENYSYITSHWCTRTWRLSGTVIYLCGVYCHGFVGISVCSWFLLRRPCMR